ncbi:MAG: OmpA family protein [Bacteroidota bacterium]
MKHLSFSGLFLALVLISTSLFAQDHKDFEKKLKEADNLQVEERVEEAIAAYGELLKMEPDNANVNYKISLFYTNSPEKIKAIPYLEKAIKNINPNYSETSLKETGAPEIALFELGEAYHLNYEFDKGIEYFEKYKQTAKPEEKIVAQVDRKIQECKNGKEFKAKPENVTIKDLGDHINSKYADYAPVISADQSTLIFTSRREGGVSPLKDNDSLYAEDIYVSHKEENGDWSTSVLMENVNSAGNDAAIGLSPDGQMLFIYKDENGDGNIWKSDLAGDKWSTPERMGPEINTPKSWEPSATITGDRKTLYFVSDKKGGLGGRDIYKCVVLPDGKWSLAQNLGPTINTPFDEDGPFISFDEKTLYFSSNGHKSMGGFDIFSSTYFPDDNAWSPPQNIGYPINTTEDDVFFVTTPDERFAYYSSALENSGYGEKDLYLVNFLDRKATNIILAIGKIINTDGPTISSDIEVMVYNLTHEGEPGDYRPNTKSGKYIVDLEPGSDYNIQYLMAGKVFKEVNVNIPKAQGYTEMMLEPVYYGKNPPPAKKTTIADVKKEEPKKEEPTSGSNFKGERIKTINFLFAFDKYYLSERAKEELNKLAKIMTDNADLTIEIQGHTDAAGSDSYNQKLSDRRAQSVINYLTAKGVAKNRLTKVSKGEAAPVAINNLENGSTCTKGMAYNRRIELRLNKNQKDFIEPMFIPKEFQIKGVNYEAQPESGDTSSEKTKF